MKHLTRRILALLLPLALLLTIGAEAVVGAEYDDTPDTMHIMETASTQLLPRVRGYAGQFADVPAGSWFYDYAVSGYEYGLFSGRADGFEPDSDVTVAELLTLSARLRAAYEGDAIPDAAPEEPWYVPYVVYLQDKGLFDAALLPRLSEDATRAELAGVFARALPEACYNAPNADLVTRAYASGNFITDVNDYTPYQSDILWLYRQGLLTGMDGSGSYWPDKTTTRAETAAVVTRMVDPALRITLAWTVLPYRSAANATFASLVKAPAAIDNYAPDPSDIAAIDALVRGMLAAGENTLTLHYDYDPSYEELSELAHTFSRIVKVYCEQMYNSVKCDSPVDGEVTLTFSATSASAAQLARLRAETLARAAELHDSFWEEGYLTPDMSEYEIARFYYIWLCNNCTYDYHAVESTSSLSHIAYSALLRKRAVCDGYTGLYNLFLKLEGIDCRALPKESINHIWTVATLDGAEYHIDVTWGDQIDGRIDMRYFAMTGAESEAVHKN